MESRRHKRGDEGEKSTFKDRESPCKGATTTRSKFKFNMDRESPTQKGRRGRKIQHCLASRVAVQRGDVGEVQHGSRVADAKGATLFLFFTQIKSKVNETTNDSNNSKAASCEMRVASCELRVASCELRVRVASGKLRVRVVEFKNDAGDVFFKELHEKTQGQNPGNV